MFELTLIKLTLSTKPEYRLNWILVENTRWENINQIKSIFNFKRGTKGQQRRSTIAYAKTTTRTGRKRRFYRLNTDVGTYARENIDSRGQTANSRASPWLPTRSLIRAKIPMIYGTIGFGKWGKRKRTTRGSVLPLTHGGDGS